MRHPGGPLRGLRPPGLGPALALVLAVTAVPARGQEPGSGAVVRAEDFAPPEEFVMVGPVKTHVVAAGDAGRPVVLVHGFGASTYTWRKNLDELAKHFRVYAMDLKGFGLTAKPRDRRYGPEDLADHLLGFLDAMGLERPIVVGHSMGGAVALHLALRHPGRLGGLVLVDAPRPGWRPSATMLPGGGRRGGETAPPAVRLALLRALITPKLVEAMLRSSYFDPSVVTPEMVEIYLRPIAIDGALEALLAMAEPDDGGARPADLPPLDSARVPTLVVWGRHDRDVPLSAGEALAGAIPGAGLVVFEGSAHLPHEEEPARFNALVAGFVLGLGAAEATR